MSGEHGLSHHAGVEVTGCPAADEGMVGRIDEVRPGFERLSSETTGHESCHQPACDRGFPATAVSTGDHYPGNIRLHDDVVSRLHWYNLSS